MSRLSQPRLLLLAEQLSDRDRAVTETVVELRLVNGEQLQRLFFADAATPATGARLARRSLGRLVDLGMLHRLERRIGGVRSGSAGYVYGLGPAGRRLVALWAGVGRPSKRGMHEPGTAFVRHTLAVADVFVRLVEAERVSGLELLAFEAEPACWRSFTGLGGSPMTLKPDACVRLGTGDYEERSFVEVDLGTEGRGALARKCRTYLAYYHSGTEQARGDVFPRVVWIATTPERARLVREVVRALPSGGERLFAITTPEHALQALVGDDREAAA